MLWMTAFASDIRSDFAEISRIFVLTSEIFLNPASDDSVRCEKRTALFSSASVTERMLVSISSTVWKLLFTPSVCRAIMSFRAETFPPMRSIVWETLSISSDCIFIWEITRSTSALIFLRASCVAETLPESPWLDFASPSTELRTVFMIPCRVCTNPLKLEATTPISSLLLTTIRDVKSPSPEPISVRRVASLSKSNTDLSTHSGMMTATSTANEQMRIINVWKSRAVFLVASVSVRFCASL